MQYIKIQPQSFLGTGEDNLMFFTIYGHGGYLVQGCQTICMACQKTFNRRYHVKSGEKLVKWLKKKTFKDYTISYMYMYNSPGAKQINPRGQNFNSN